MKSTISCLTTLLAIIALMVLSGIFFFGNPKDPDGLRQKIFCPLGLVKMPGSENKDEIIRPAAARTAETIAREVANADDSSLKALLKDLDEYSGVMEQVKTASDPEKFKERLKNVPGRNPVLQGNWEFFYYTILFRKNPEKTLDDPRFSKLMESELKNHPCKTCGGSFTVPCKRCFPQSAKQSDRKEAATDAAEESKEPKKRYQMTMGSLSSTNEKSEQGVTDDFSEKAKERLNAITQTPVKKKEKQQAEESTATENNKENKRNETAKTGGKGQPDCPRCKGTGKNVCPRCVKTIRALSGELEKLMQEEIRNSRNAIRKEVSSRTKAAKDKSIENEDDED